MSDSITQKETEADAITNTELSISQSVGGSAGLVINATDTSIPTLLSNASKTPSVAPKRDADGTPGAAIVPSTEVSAPSPVLKVPMASSTNETISSSTVIHVAEGQCAPSTVVVPAAKTKSKKKKGAIPTVTMATAPSTSSSSQGTHGENTGRWTAEEHRLFLQGLEQHGKGWKKIASLIKSRTVVQIRTHAQKYFQKLAKARQNGEEGDVSMEGRGGASSMASGGVAGSNGGQIKRRRQTTGTKRKAISSVVASAQRQGKKIAAAQAAAGVPCPKLTLPAVAPALAPFVLPQQSQTAASGGLSGSSTQGVISGPALEDSLFRFLTPAPGGSTVDPLSAPVNEVARQAGANPITLPTDTNSSIHPVAGGEVSPTGVADVSLVMADAKDLPPWYSKGADVDILLDVADTLDWLADTGDLQETYQAQPEEVKQEEAPQLPFSETTLVKPPLAQTTSVASLVTQESEVPPLPSLFEGTEDTDASLRKEGASSGSLADAPDGIDDHLNVFDTPMEEHAFVSALLENNGDSSESLPVLG